MKGAGDTRAATPAHIIVHVCTCMHTTTLSEKSSSKMQDASSRYSGGGILASQLGPPSHRDGQQYVSASVARLLRMLCVTVS